MFLMAAMGMWASNTATAADGAGNIATGTQPVAPAVARPRAASGFVLTEFATDLRRPVTLLALPNGDLLVEERGAPGTPGRALILRDVDRDGRAEQRAVLLTDIDAPAAWLLRRDRLYRAHAAGLDRCAFLVGQMRATSACRPIGSFAPARRDTPVALAMYPDESRLLLLRDDGIVSLSPDGGDARAVPNDPILRPRTLALEPRLARPWVALAPSPVADGVGSRVTLQALAPSSGSGNSLSIPSAGTPAALLFYRRRALPAELHGAALLALGAVGGETATPARVVAIPFAAGRAVGPPRDLLVGRDSGAGVTFDPVALAVLDDGAIVVADAAGGTVWRLDYLQ